MKQYCQYCAYCFDGGDDYRCSNHPKGEQPHWTEQDIKRANNCPNYAYSDMGSVIAGKQYKPRVKEKINNDSEVSLRLPGMDN